MVTDLLKGDHVSTFIDMIVAGFDVLSNSQARNEDQQTINIYRSFLMNRLPPILALISSSSLEPISANLCISQALGRIDLGAFPLSAYDMDKRSTLADVRQEFLFACALHRIIPENNIEPLLGENPMQTLPAHGLYDKELLVQQISGTTQRGDQLVKEIELMEGNSGVIAIAIVEVRLIDELDLATLANYTQVLHSHCRNRDTVPLKDLCNSIVRRSNVLDVIASFKSPAFIVSPLCSLLDNWNWDDIHGKLMVTGLSILLTSGLGESQPVYEEFGAALLLVLTVACRFELGVSDLGITNTSSFVRQLLEMNSTEERLEDLDETRKRHLGDWINALFVADSLTDDLTSSCPPHEFYKLVPTLLSQSLEACASGRLGIEALKSGFDCK
jgi:mediator of RNA polymerase II transcription subunit 5